MTQPTTLRQAVDALVPVILPTLKLFVVAWVIISLLCESIPRFWKPLEIEEIILETQRERINTLSSIDTLIIGDSSGLMNLDAPYLSEKLGQKIESIATLGWVGFKGYSTMLDAYLETGRSIESLVLILTPSSFALTEKEFSLGYEDRAAPRGDPDDSLLLKIRKAMSDLLLLPGMYRSEYGRVKDLRSAIESGWGTTYDPNVSLKSSRISSRSVDFSLSDSVQMRIPVFRELVYRKLLRTKVDFIISPIPETLAPRDSKERLERLRGQLIELFAPVQLKFLDLPATLPDSLFGTETHLNRKGRSFFSTLMAEKLSHLE
jgi:hypothetical protein